MKRLATFWLLCAAIGFGVVAGMACVLCLAVDGKAPWQRHAPRIAEAHQIP